MGTTYRFICEPNAPNPVVQWFRALQDAPEEIEGQGVHRNEWDYYLEGSVRNRDAPVYALTGGLEALRRGQYFVAAEDNDFVLDKLCAQLRLRGVQCEPTRESGSLQK